MQDRRREKEMMKRGQVPSGNCLVNICEEIPEYMIAVREEVMVGEEERGCEYVRER